MEAYITEKAQLDVTSSSSRREKLEACVGRIAQSEGVPPFCDHANEVLIRTLDIEEGSSKKLVQVVLQDVGLATQVLRLANSAMYKLLTTTPCSAAVLGQKGSQ